jgi:hypothetical protein
VTDTEQEPRAEIPAALWERVRADPVHAPEYIALAAAERFGPAADAWVQERGGGAPPAELARQAKRRHASMAGLGGAATGVGGAFTVVPNLIALLWVQSRMVFFIAAALGHDPRDPMRPAELLVLMGLYDDVAKARRALDGAGRPLAFAFARSRVRRSEGLSLRLARRVGTRTASRYAGRFVPVVGIAINAVANERETRALADRAIAFYDR